MIRVDRVPEPAGFDSEVRQRGNTWLQGHSTGRPLSLWSKFRDALASGFNWLCGYAAMYEPVGTVDHFIPISKERSLAYEWSNYRYASSWINSRKQGFIVLDPYEVQNDWFEIHLPSLQLIITDKIPPALRESAKNTLTVLGLRDDERIIRQRRHWMIEYEQTGDIGILERNAPLLARAVIKRQQETNKCWYRKEVIIDLSASCRRRYNAVRLKNAEAAKHAYPG